MEEVKTSNGKHVFKKFDEHWSFPGLALIPLFTSLLELEKVTSQEPCSVLPAFLGPSGCLRISWSPGAPCALPGAGCAAHVISFKPLPRRGIISTQVRESRHGVHSFIRVVGHLRHY